MNKEWREYDLVDKKEAEQLKKTRMEQKRQVDAQQKEEKIVMRLYEKQSRLMLDSSDVSVCSVVDFVVILLLSSCVRRGVS